MGGTEDPRPTLRRASHVRSRLWEVNRPGVAGQVALVLGIRAPLGILAISPRDGDHKSHRGPSTRRVRLMLFQFERRNRDVNSRLGPWISLRYECDGPRCVNV
jgi:hypothetical protein